MLSMAIHSMETTVRLNMRLLAWLQAHDKATETGNKVHIDHCWFQVKEVVAELESRGVEVDVTLRQKISS